MMISVGTKIHCIVYAFSVIKVPQPGSDKHLNLRNCQEISFSIAGFKVEILKWKVGTAQNKATLKQHKMKPFTRTCRRPLLRVAGHRGSGVSLLAGQKAKESAPDVP